MRLEIALILASLLLLPACGDDGTSGDDDDVIDAALPDGPPQTPDAPQGCDPVAALPLDWRPQDEVSTGAVTNTAGTPNILEIDATAGGIDNYDTNPFVYLSFAGGAATKVEITDVAARSSTEWHIGLKRYLVLVNGGDSGPGAVRIAEVTAASLDEVTAAPPASEFETDDWATEECVLVPGQMGEPWVACDWWVMNDTTMQVDPRPVVWVIDLDGAGTLIKLRFVNYYGDPASPGSSANYWIEWATL